VQVYFGKEREALLDMLPYMHLGYVLDFLDILSKFSRKILIVN